MFGVLVFTVLFAWMLVHRFRIAWLESEIEQRGLEQALIERRAEGRVDARSSDGRGRGATVNGLGYIIAAWTLVSRSPSPPTRSVSCSAGAL